MAALWQQIVLLVVFGLTIAVILWAPRLRIPLPRSRSLSLTLDLGTAPPIAVALLLALG